MSNEIESVKPIPGFTFFASPNHGISVMYGDELLTLGSAGDAIELIEGLVTVLGQHGYNIQDYLKRGK